MVSFEPKAVVMSCSAIEEKGFKRDFPEYAKYLYVTVCVMWRIKSSR